MTDEPAARPLRRPPLEDPTVSAELAVIEAHLEDLAARLGTHDLHVPGTTASRVDEALRAIRQARAGE